VGAAAADRRRHRRGGRDPALAALLDDLDQARRLEASRIRTSLCTGTTPWSDTTSSASRAGSSALHIAAAERSTERPIRLRPSRAASAEPGV